jgi:thiazole synthase ThiGH ThiG subunit
MTLATRLQQSKALLAPGIYDALTALVAEQAGFEALYLSGASIAYTRLGRSDVGLTTATEVADSLARITERVRLPVIVDAGLGAPSHAAEALELGADAVLVNTAIASSGDPVAMARAFRLAVEAGRTAREAGLGVGSDKAEPTSPLTGFLD